MVRSMRGFDALCVDQENARSRITRKLVYAWLRSGAALSGYPLPSITPHRQQPSTGARRRGARGQNRTELEGELDGTRESGDGQAGREVERESKMKRTTSGQDTGNGAVKRVNCHGVLTPLLYAVHECSEGSGKIKREESKSQEGPHGYELRGRAT